MGRGQFHSGVNGLSCGPSCLGLNLGWGHLCRVPGQVIFISSKNSPFSLCTRKINTTLHFDGYCFKDRRNLFIFPTLGVPGNCKFSNNYSVYMYIQGDYYVIYFLPLLVFFLIVKQISDWWQQYVYLRSREPLMINSNYYGVVSICYCHSYTI